MKATADIDPQIVKKLREKTNVGMMDCKRALTESGGDLDKAEAILRTKGIASASKKASRATKEGIVAAYIHLQGKVGVLVEVNCETDFVAKNENFRAFVKDITLHIAAAHPLYVTREEVPPHEYLALLLYEAPRIPQGRGPEPGRGASAMGQAAAPDARNAGSERVSA